MAWDLLGFGAVLAVLAAAGLRSAQRTEGYLVANRSVGLGALVATLVMTEFNTSTLLAFTGLGHTVGPMALGLPLVFLVGLGFYTVTVARPWKRFDRLSVAELFTERYGRGLGRLASAFLLLAMVGFSATYVKSLTLLMEPFTRGLPLLGALGPWALGSILTALVVVVTISGGLVSIVRSDVVSFVLTLVVVGALLAAALGGATTETLASAFPEDQRRFAPVEQWSHPALPYWYVLSLTVLTMFTYISSPWYGQKIFAATDERTAFLAVGISALVVFLLYGSLLLAAAYYRGEVGALADPQWIVPEMIATWLPPALRGVAYGTLFAVALTTLAGVWNAMVAMLVADFQVPGLSMVRGQRAATVGLALLGVLGANLLVEDLLSRLVLANVPIAALSFALLAGFHWPRASRAGAWASVVVGFAWGAGCFVVVGEAGGYTWYWAMYGIPLVFAVGIAGSLLVPDRAPVADPEKAPRASGSLRTPVE